MPERVSPNNLKILIVSAPKTGNTWLKYLLSVAYQLPVAEFPTPGFWSEFDPVKLDVLGERWVAHQHFPPLDSFVDAAAQVGVTLVTTVRHPADVLVSLYHHVQNFAEKTYVDPDAMQLLISKAEEGAIDPYSLQLSRGLEVYVRDFFFKALNFSVAWLERGLTFGIRYEDLWHSPAETLKAFTDHICPLPPEHITKAVQEADLEQMRKHAKEHAAFFRAGGIDGGPLVCGTLYRSALRAEG